MTDDKPLSETKRYSVYNTTLGRFVGGVTRDKPTQAEAKELAPEGHKLEVREVQ